MATPPRVQVRLPRHLAYGFSAPTRLEVEADSIPSLWSALEAQVPGLSRRLTDDQGVLRHHLLLFVNESAVAASEASRVSLRAGDRVLIVASVSGGS